jgi:hypothetical protein
VPVALESMRLNGILGDEGAKAIAAALPKCKALKKLYRYLTGS